MNLRALPTCVSAFALWSGVSAIACREHRGEEARPPVYADVEPLLGAACMSCHGATPEAGYAVTRYWEVIGCSAAGIPAVLPADDGAPLLRVLSRSDHAGLLSVLEAAQLTRWVEAGVPLVRGTVHAAGIMDPRSEDWHGYLAQQAGFAALRDASDQRVCGRCHDDAPVRPEGVLFAAPDATACSTCHRQPRGVLACPTCHGAGDRAYPPRDACYFQTGGPDAHAAHLEGVSFRAAPLDCQACHPPPEVSLFHGQHANGKLDVTIAPPWSSEGALPYLSAEATCVVSCHDRGGSLPRPDWFQTASLDCQSCHQSPPGDHYAGPCARCHAEMGAEATSLRPGALHINGTVDLGDGSQDCGACHGGDDGLPEDRVHRRHTQTALTQPLVCDDCHRVPEQAVTHGHPNGQIDVVFGARAQAGDPAPRWVAADKRCENVACHAGAGEDASIVLRWDSAAGPQAQRCNLCHASPPPLPHVQQTNCGGSLCHGDEVALADEHLRITDPGRELHINGRIDTAPGERR